MVLITAIAVLIVLGLASLRRRRRARGNELYRPQAWLPTAIVLLVASLHAGDFQAAPDGPPLLIVIAADVSLSMGTRPQPGTHPVSATRMERARSALLPLLRELDASTHRAMVAVTAFTAASETLLAWSDNLPQVREAVRYVLAPGLLTLPGSDLGAGLAGALPLFQSVPGTDAGEEYAKYLIVVSDGEENVDTAGAEPLAELRDAGVCIIALHVGLRDVPEGLPLYDAGGTFAGFEPVGGQIVSIPDQDTMRVLAGADQAAGLFLKAEQEDASDVMLDYMGVRAAGKESAPLRTGLVLVLWFLVMAALLRYV